MVSTCARSPYNISGWSSPRRRPRHGARNRLLRRVKTFAITLGVLAVIGGIIYGLASSPSIAYNERDLHGHRFHVVERGTETSRARRGECRPLHVRMRHGARAVRGHRYDLSGPHRQHHKNSGNGSEGTELWRRIVKKLLVCVAVALLAVGCNSDDGGGSPTDPSQVNVEFSTTDLVVGTGRRSRAWQSRTVNLRAVALQPGRDSK